MKRKAIVGLLATVLINHSAFSQSVYVCVDANGQKSYSNNPFCVTRQPYANKFEVKIEGVEIANHATNPGTHEIYDDGKSKNLASYLEELASTAGFELHPIDLEGKNIKPKKGFYEWNIRFDHALDEFDLDYRKAFGNIYIYQRASMGEAIATSPDLIRWYQSEDDWKIVREQDAMLPEGRIMYENATFKEWKTELIKRVKIALGEPVVINQAASVNVNSSAGGISSVVVVDAPSQNMRMLIKKQKKSLAVSRR